MKHWMIRRIGHSKNVRWVVGFLLISVEIYLLNNNKKMFQVLNVKRMKQMILYIFSVNVQWSERVDSNKNISYVGVDNSVQVPLFEFIHNTFL